MSEEPNNATKPGGSGNINGLEDAIKGRFEAEVDARLARQKINATLNLARATLEEKGVPKKIQAVGVTYMMFTAEERAVYKEMIDIITPIIDDNFEPDLFKPKKPEKKSE